MKEGLIARGMNPDSRELVIDPDFNPNDWAGYQRRVLELMIAQGIEIDSKAAGFAIGDLAAKGVFNGQPVNVETLNAALAKAAQMGL